MLFGCAEVQITFSIHEHAPISYRPRSSPLSCSRVAHEVLAPVLIEQVVGELLKGDGSVLVHVTLGDHLGCVQLTPGGLGQVSDVLV